MDICVLLFLFQLEALQEEIFVLNEQVCTHKEQIADCESTMNVTSDALTGLRNTLLEFMKAEKAVNGLFDKISACNATEQFSLLKSFYKPLVMNCQNIKSKSNQVISDIMLIEYLSMFRQKVENIQVEEPCGEVNIRNITDMKVSLDKMKKELFDENIAKLDCIEEDKTSDSGIEEDKLTDSGKYIILCENSIFNFKHYLCVCVAGGGAREYIRLI